MYHNPLKIQMIEQMIKAFYTLETHEFDIQKIDPEAESSRGGVVKAASPGRSPVIKYNNFFEKFKPIDDLLGLKYKEKYPEVLFTVEEYSDSDHRDIVAILQPFVGQVVDLKKKEFYGNLEFCLLRIILL